jgi:hypothetical protein
MAQGTIADPMTLADALTSDRIQPGHTVWLMDGNYRADVTVILEGTAEQPITIKPMPGARPVIDSDFWINGAYLIFDGLEFASGRFTTRLSEEAGSGPTDLPNPQLTINGPGVAVRNCIIHDVRDVNSWMPATGAEFYGNVIYNWGWQGPDRAHGPGQYIQNGDGAKSVKHNVWAHSFWHPIQARTSEKRIDNLHILENVFVRAGSLRNDGQGPAPGIYYNDGDVAQNPIVSGNLAYGCDPHRLWYTTGVENGVLTNNYNPDGVEKAEEGIVEDSGNFWGPAPDSGQKHVLWPNEYDEGRAILTAYNWDEADTVEVDVLAWLELGQQVRARSVQDYFMDIATLTVGAEGTLSLDMRAESHTIAQPVGWYAGETTFPAFGCWILEKLD